MSPALFALWALAGWCGTPYPRWWWRIPPPPWPPDPEPWWRSKVIGVVAGVIGGWALSQVFGPGPQPWTVVPAAASALGGFFLSRLVGDLLNGIAGRGGTTRG
jgi:hypothetical protein